jgi:diadenylate cyclase
MADVLHYLGLYWTRILDVLIVTVFFYYLLVYIRRSRAVLIFWAVVVAAGVYYLAQYLRLAAVVFLLGKIMVIGPLIIVIIFAPEIRMYLERASRFRVWARAIMTHPEERPRSTLEEIESASERLAEAHVGAIIVIEMSDPCEDAIVPGETVDSQVSERLIVSIFNPSGPLHDGAVVVSGERLVLASSFLPLSERDLPMRNLGTRHRAAIGLSEKTDALVVVVSEERGTVSVVHHGRIALDLTKAQFRSQLEAIYYPNPAFASCLPRMAV